ncbi:MAG: hypothetical protein IT429_21600 [Gemmataceae bacterium]|nr:hypothetical protein [Gemmataceae bacterium]
MVNLSKVCYTVCIVCIVVGTLLSIVLIWEGLNNVVAWKGLGTVTVFFFASLITLAVHAMFSSTLRRAPWDQPGSGRTEIEPGERGPHARGIRPGRDR